MAHVLYNTCRIETHDCSKKHNWAQLFLLWDNIVGKTHKPNKIALKRCRLAVLHSPSSPIWRKIQNSPRHACCNATSLFFPPPFRSCITGTGHKGVATCKGALVAPTQCGFSRACTLASPLCSVHDRLTRPLLTHPPKITKSMLAYSPSYSSRSHAA